MRTTLLIGFVCAATGVAHAQETEPDEGESLATTLGLAGETDSRGEIAFESRFFSEDDDDGTEDAGVGMLGRLELTHDHAPLKERLRVYGRLDAMDDARTMLVVEEAWAQVRWGRLQLRLGADVLNWTATEAFHPADAVNARNVDSELESYEKVGEPMIAVQTALWSDAALSVYYMPYATEPILASPSSRLSIAPPGVPFGERVILDERGRPRDSDFAHQGAVRLRQTLGSADLSVHVLHHVDRSQPTVGFDAAAGTLRPIYQTVSQAGGTYQHALGPVVLKLEGVYRRFAQPDGDMTAYGPLPVRDHGAVAAGLEYVLPHDNGWESVLVVEGQTILGVDRATRSALHPFQRDALLGWRLALNDESSSELTVLAIVDLERDREGLASVTYKQRVGETWSLLLGGRVVLTAAPEHGRRNLAAIRNADYVRLSLARHF